MPGAKLKLLPSLCFLGAAALSAPTYAQSSVQLYGLIDSYVGVVKNPGGHAAAVMQGGGMSTSFWGLKGTEDLGGGYTTFFVLESYFLSQNGNYGRFSGDSFFSRNAYVGIGMPYGSIRAGRLTTPLYISTINLNPFFNSYTFSPWIFHTFKGLGPQGVVGDSGWNNAVAYTSPTISGFSGTAIYGFGNTAGDAGAHKWGANLTYQMNALLLAANYQYINFSNTPADIGSALPSVPGLRAQETIQLAGSYNFNVMRVFLGYMNIRDDARLGETNSNTEQVGVSVPVSTHGFVLADFAYTKSTGPQSGDVHRATWAVGYDLPVSKRTDLYAAFKYDRYASQSTGLTYGVGLRHNF
ncbi:porin [Paraburkholderia xenovorans]|uniref:porin n=1 Tax=Paraburkholderia xenovorans TaxID=36873 RepID=UPI0038B750A6